MSIQLTEIVPDLLEGSDNLLTLDIIKLDKAKP
jgi:hypothetical protein